MNICQNNICGCDKFHRVDYANNCTDLLWAVGAHEHLVPHLLEVCVEAGKSFRTPVIEGVLESAYTTFVEKRAWGCATAVVPFLRDASVPVLTAALGCDVSVLNELLEHTQTHSGATEAAASAVRRDRREHFARLYPYCNVNKLKNWTDVRDTDALAKIENWCLAVETAGCGAHVKQSRKI